MAHTGSIRKSQTNSQPTKATLTKQITISMPTWTRISSKKTYKCSIHSCQRVNLAWKSALPCTASLTRLTNRITSLSTDSIHWNVKWCLLKTVVGTVSNTTTICNSRRLLRTNERPMMCNRMVMEACFRQMQLRVRAVSSDQTRIWAGSRTSWASSSRYSWNSARWWKTREHWIVGFLVLAEDD